MSDVTRCAIRCSLPFSPLEAVSLAGAVSVTIPTCVFAVSSLVFVAAKTTLSYPTLLIVDDEQNIRSSLKGALGREGYQVDDAATLAVERLVEDVGAERIEKAGVCPLTAADHSATQPRRDLLGKVRGEHFFSRAVSHLIHRQMHLRCLE